MKQHNLILLADAYKYSHHKLYYPGTTKVYSYLESRGGVYPNTVFFGLQYFLKHYLEGQAFTSEDLDEAERMLKQVFGRSDVFDRSKFEYILNKYDGHLPVRIKAVPEGTTVPVRNVLMTIESTDPECFWLSNFLETLLMQIWYPCTVATLSHEVRQTILNAFEETASAASMTGIELSLNDFGFRGVSSVESAGLGGAAHLVSFKGSDNLAGSSLAFKYYHARTAAGLSIPATEHSNMTLLGESGEKKIFKHVLDTFPNGLVACVSDSYDIFRAVEEYWGNDLKDQILQRDGTLVIRPDSGDPIQTIQKLFEILFDRFGYEMNEKGFKVLPSQVRVIQGDGVNPSAIKSLLESLRDKGISAENIVFGMGGALLQKVNRDTQKYAIKCSYAELNGEEVDVRKNPVEMNADGEIIPSFKTSKAGRLKLIRLSGKFTTVREEEYPDHPDELVTVFENGKIIREWTFEEIRHRAGIPNLVSGEQLV